MLNYIGENTIRKVGNTMQYTAKTIKTPYDIGTCEPFPITAFNWGGDYRPRSYGCMGNFQHKGLMIKLVSEEQKPLHEFYHHNKPIYLDSSLCTYMRFGNAKSYFGFEMNANGALYASYGSDREQRTTFSNLFLQRFHCISNITPRYWAVTLCLPYEALAEVQDIPILGPGDVFYCNFGKQKSSKPLEHYATWNPIDTLVPDFHRPEYFGKITIV